ncbi:MAG: hypothetical protein HYS98_06380 [Deltaproteobacteria bacterium]|nr:hypothetical protein [Deltaproteobacteria bacterium]
MRFASLRVLFACSMFCIFSLYAAIEWSTEKYDREYDSKLKCDDLIDNMRSDILKTLCDQTCDAIGCDCMYDPKKYPDPRSNVFKCEQQRNGKWQVQVACWCDASSSDYRDSSVTSKDSQKYERGPRSKDRNDEKKQRKHIYRHQDKYMRGMPREPGFQDQKSTDVSGPQEDVIYPRNKDAMPPEKSTDYGRPSSTNQLDENGWVNLQNGPCEDIKDKDGNVTPGCYSLARRSVPGCSQLGCKKIDKNLCTLQCKE